MSGLFVLAQKASDMEFATTRGRHIKTISLCVLRVVACKLPHLLYGAVFVARHILSDIRHGVPAAQLGAKGTYPFCL